MFIVGIGGTTRQESSSEKILRTCLGLLSEKGSQVAMFSGKSLVLPMYEPGIIERNASASRLVDAIRCCDALIVASPGYHGTVSGMVKNALDYMEELRGDERPYLHGRPVGCIACAQGWQAAVSTLASLRAIAHALRGWPTPMGAAINTSVGLFADNGQCIDRSTLQQLEIICDQIFEFGKAGQAAPQT